MMYHHEGVMSAEALSAFREEAGKKCKEKFNFNRKVESFLPGKLTPSMFSSGGGKIDLVDTCTADELRQVEQEGVPPQQVPEGTVLRAKKAKPDKK